MKEEFDREKPLTGNIQEVKDMIQQIEVGH